LTQILSQCTAATLADAAQSLKSGALIAFPTETVYGLGADATNPAAVARIYSVKGRPQDHPLIVHIADISQLDQWACEIPEYAIALAREYWPGPMTLVLKRTDLAKDFITGSQETVGIRVPAHAVALGLLNEFHKIGGLGIAAPSANRFGHVSPTTAQAVAEELSEYLDANDRILDGGPSLVGVESTIIDCTNNAPRILRLGAITKEMIETCTVLSVTENPDTKIRASGMLENHYAPKATVVLDVLAEPGEGLIAPVAIPTPNGVIRLASPGTVEQYARDLYAALRLGDSKGLSKIVALQPEGEDLAAAIRDRLQRASRGR
jgi:L-threonylcarbamoyladenylate synthase